MYFRKLLAASVLSAGVLGPSMALASRPQPPCVLHEHRVTSVKPYRVTERVGRASVTRLRGAQLFIPAERGLTAEWLEAKFVEHTRKMRSSNMKNCVFGVPEVTVGVDSAGPGFVVKLAAKNEGIAEEVLRRARLLTSM